MQNHPLNKVVFIQRVAAFVSTDSPKDLFQLAYVNDSWNDTIKNYAFHIFEDRVRKIKYDDTLERTYDSVIRPNVIWAVDAFLSKTVLDRVDRALCLACEHASSPEVMKLLVEKILKVSGNDLHMLKNQIVAVDDQSWSNCLMHACGRFSSPEVVELLFQKIAEVGGEEFLKSQFMSQERAGLNLLTRSCCACSSPEVMKLVFDKIVEVCGPDLFKSQLTATSSCLRLCCACSSSPEVMKLVFRKIVEVGGTDGMKRHLVTIDEYDSDCLMHCCRNSDYPEFMKFIASALVHVNLFQQQYAKYDEHYQKRLKDIINVEDASWTPDADSAAEVKKIFDGEF